MSVTAQEQTRKMDAYDTIYKALCKEMKRRSKNGDKWVERERSAVTKAARRWSSRNNGYRVTDEQVDAEERYAMGSSDYANKWALRVAECAVFGERLRDWWEK